MQSDPCWETERHSIPGWALPVLVPQSRGKGSAILTSEIAGSQGLHIFSFRQRKRFFKVLMPIYTPTSNEQELCSSISLPTRRCFFAFFISAIPVGAWWYHAGFHFYSLVTNEVVDFLC